MAEPNDPSQDFYDEDFIKIQQEYIDSIPGKLKNIEKLVNELRHEITEESLQEINRIVHRMAGSAGAYGFMQVTEICRKFDLELIQKIRVFKESGGQESWIANFDDYLKKIKQGFSINNS